ncbi:MAG: hypothetical protein A3G18_10890 [Rhodospirillales bacterium RIFCSPLOWO2_12_FULL_58_28]|nr:MAG: hypothetical protein A3H92_11245 [Rhodospirillales bacterium RIFCSPLOWO2_02_FULL_58_16]OHC77923.1 MAG: hypothetical protein A3G18_10890 [Rhodospirillales bacterium RIFCSPLOWO2_12_FULL_58_28]
MVMFGLSVTGSIFSQNVEALVDAVVLTVLSTPFIYFWVIKPFIEARNQAINDIQKAHDKLEARVEERTFELAVARDGAEMASRAKSSFLAAMSHELRTPLNAIIGFSEMMSRKTFGPLGDSRYADYANDIRASGLYLLDMINDILDLSKVEAGKQALLEEELNVSSIVSSSLEMVRERAKDAKVEMTAELPADTPRLLADGRMFKQIMLNLLTNAIKFTPEGGKVTISGDIGGDGSFSLRVTDSGIGIAEEDLAVILSPFGQVDNEYTRRHKGSGLGIPLVKELIEMHGGALKIESAVGIGTTIIINLPAWRIINLPVIPTSP